MVSVAGVVRHHVRQLDRVSRELLARAWAAGAGPGSAPFTIDFDSTICETYLPEPPRHFTVVKDYRCLPGETATPYNRRCSWPFPPRPTGETSPCASIRTLSAPPLVGGHSTTERPEELAARVRPDPPRRTAASGARTDRADRPRSSAASKFAGHHLRQQPRPPLIDRCHRDRLPHSGRLTKSLISWH